MDKNERNKHLGIDTNMDFQVTELQQLKWKEGIVAEVWHKVRKAVILAKNIFRIAPKWRIALEAFISLMDEFFGTGK